MLAMRNDQRESIGGGRKCAIEAKPAMKNRFSELDVPPDLYRARWGRLQSRALYCLLDNHGRATTSAISAYCWDGQPTSSQSRSQRRAARSIGARPVRRAGRQWIWRLPDA